MRKIWSLYVNEIIKTKKRISIIIIMCIMVALVFGYGGLMKFYSSIMESSTTYSSSSYMSGEQNAELIETAISEAEEEIATLNSQLAQSTDETEKINIQYQIDSKNIQIEYYNLAKENNIDIYYGTGYKSSSAKAISSIKTAILEIQYGYSNGSDSEIEFYKEVAEKYIKVVEEEDYALFLDVQREIINFDTTLTEDSKQLQLEAIDLMEEANPDGEESSALDYQIQQLITAEMSLVNGVNSEGAVLSPDEEKELEDSVIVMKYEIKNSYGTSSDSQISGTAMSGMIGLGIWIIAILLIILAGGAISSELSSGTIKSLIISPTRRWKIFTAKFLSITTIGIICSLLTLLFACLSFLIFFGPGEMSPYVYASGGEAHAIPFILYQLSYTLLEFFDVFVFMVFAFMLSIITKNTAASVGISLGVYFAGGLLFGILSSLITSRWMDFIPFTNMNIADRVFSNSAASDIVGQAGMGSMLDGGIPVGFSVVYLLVLVACMLWIGFDSFTRKDI